MSITKDGETYFTTAPDALEIEIGDAKQVDFFPQVKIKKWNNEVNFSMRLITPEKGSAAIASDTILWQGDQKAAEFYPIDPKADLPEGGFEFNIILDRQPATPQIDFSIVSKDVELIRQPALSELIGQDGIVTATETEAFDRDGKRIFSRPPEIVGSYAVYHRAPPKNFINGVNYRSGKIGHIPRPRITESGGKTILGEFRLDIEKNILSVLIDEQFLRDALYPVMIDPTFGYATAGASSAFLTFGVCDMGAALRHAAGANERITKFSIYGSGTSCQMAAYEINTGTGVPGARLAAGVAIALPGSAAWTDSAAVAQNMSNGTTYGPASSVYTLATIYFDTGSGNQRSNSLTNTMDNPWQHAGFSAVMYSQYATYEVFENTRVSIIFDD